MNGLSLPLLQRAELASVSGSQFIVRFRAVFGRDVHEIGDSGIIDDS
jgi:hypothetical protein